MALHSPNCVASAIPILPFDLHLHRPISGIHLALFFSPMAPFLKNTSNGSRTMPQKPILQIHLYPGNACTRKAGKKTSLKKLKNGALPITPMAECREVDKGDSTVSITVVGASGDLAKKKIYPAIFALYYENCLPKFQEWVELTWIPAPMIIPMRKLGIILAMAIIKLSTTITLAYRHSTKNR